VTLTNPTAVHSNDVEYQKKCSPRKEENRAEEFLTHKVCRRLAIVNWAVAVR
jgi:hypothetical protein